MRSIVISGIAFAMISCVSGQALAELSCGPLGEWNGTMHNVPQASCHPRCEGPNGDDHDFEDKFPDNVLLDSTKREVSCSGGGGNPCAFLADGKVSVDNVTRKVFTHVKSRSLAVRVKPVVCILEIKSNQ